jgi:hypothetical protein
VGLGYQRINYAEPVNYADSPPSRPRGLKHDAIASAHLISGAHPRPVSVPFPTPSPETRSNSVDAPYIRRYQEVLSVLGVLCGTGVYMHDYRRRNVTCIRIVVARYRAIRVQ